MESKTVVIDNSSIKQTVGVGAYAPYLTVFVSSGCIMIIELVAGRLISRYVGQSVYTWTAIIGVVLAGIALGNYVGGRIADRSWGRGTLAVQFLAAAGGCLLALLLNRLAGAWVGLMGLPWPARIFLHVTAAFLIPSALLGTISPVVAKRALVQGLAMGRTMGNVYAWAIGGGICGTFLTGYYLLTWFNASSIVAGAAGALGLLGGIYGLGSLGGRRDGTAMAVSAGGVEKTESPLWHIRGPLLAVFLANVCLMIIEIVAGRLASRFYGQSVYSWTTVIGMILAGMTAGSYIGGRAADRFRVDSILSTLFISSSVLCMAIPLMTNIVVHTSVVRMLYGPYQNVVYISTAYLLPSILIGATAPVLARLALFRAQGAGRIVGLVYSVGSAGSIAGTFLAGYFLIAAAGTMRTLALVALALALIAVVYESNFSFSHAWAFCCSVLLVGAFIPSMPVLGRVSAALLLGLIGPPDALFVDESPYSFISVTAEKDAPNIRQLVLDQLIHSKADLDNPLDLKYEYHHIYDAVVDACFGAGKPVTALNLGGGGYVFPRYIELSRPGSYVEVAEIDARVTEAAHEAFGLPRDTAITSFHMDARNRVADLVRLKQEGKEVPRFDCILGDSFNDYSVPYHLTTLEFSEQLRGLMTERGVYILNIIDVMDSGQFLSAMVKTCRQAFPHVYVFDTLVSSNTRETFVIVSSLEPIDAAVIQQSIKDKRGYEVRLLEKELEPLLAEAPLLTDDFAPVENMLAAVVQYSQEQPTAALMKAANTYFEQGKFKPAIRKARRALAMSPELPDAYELIGACFLSLGRLDEAAAAIERVIEIKEDAADAYESLMNIYAQKRDYDSAIRIGSEGLTRYPDTPALLRGLGAAYVYAGIPAAAVQPLTRAVELEPDDVSAHNTLATAYFNTRNHAQAIKELNRVIEIDPQVKNIYRQLAVAYFNVKDYDNAWASVKKAQENQESLDPKFLESLSRDSGRSLLQGAS